MRAKGVQAVRLTKVKAHTAGEELERGEISREDRRGHAKADEEAEVAATATRPQHEMSVRTTPTLLTDGTTPGPGTRHAEADGWRIHRAAPRRRCTDFHMVMWSILQGCALAPPFSRAFYRRRVRDLDSQRECPPRPHVSSVT